VPAVVFYFDLGSPYAYLSAERLPPEVTWQPILLGGIFKLTGRSSWARTGARAEGIAEVERRAAAYGLPPLSWPDPWPSDYLYAMRAATAASAAGFGREFALQAFRDQFQRGRGMHEHDNVDAAAAAVGLALSVDDDVKGALRDATQAAYERGVIGVPTLAVGDTLYWGDDRLDEALA
jgi:2-hydroxychromene-2-carboxylate isomerase